jgi:ABC-type glutathione transport system ATPase component
VPVPVSTPAPPAQGASAIHIQGLTKRYATREGELLAIDRLDARMADASFVAIVGPSGCGKSTLLKILAGLQPVSTGEVAIRARAAGAGGAEGFREPLPLGAVGRHAAARGHRPVADQ